MIKWEIKGPVTESEEEMVPENNNNNDVMLLTMIDSDHDEGEEFFLSNKVGQTWSDPQDNSKTKVGKSNEKFVGFLQVQCKQDCRNP